MKNIYNKVMSEAAMLHSTLAVWVSTEKTFGMAVFMASAKSLLLKNRSISAEFSCAFSESHSVMLLV